MRWLSPSRCHVAARPSGDVRPYSFSLRASRTWSIAGASLFIVMTLIALAAPILSPHDPLVPVGVPLAAPGHDGFLLGSDTIGRDVLSRTLYGVRASWFAALVVVAGGLLIGGLIGVVAGASGGRVDNLLMRITDIFLALPAPVLAIAVVASLGPSFSHTLIAVSIVWWPFYARIVRGEINKYAARPHVEAARLAGAGRIRIAVRHLLPGRASGIDRDREPRRRQPRPCPGRTLVPRTRSVRTGS